MTDRLIPPHGGYKNLLAFQKAEIVYDATVKSCADLLSRCDRTVDQMVQAGQRPMKWATYEVVVSRFAV